MSKARRREKIWLTVAILTAVSGVLGIPALAFSALSRMYVLMGVLIAVVGHGFYGVTFYFIAYANARARIHCISAVTEKGVMGYSEISAVTMLTESTVIKRLSECIDLGYIQNFRLGEDTLVSTETASCV